MDRLIPLRKASNSPRVVVIPREMVDAVSRGERLDSSTTGAVWMPPGTPPNIVISPEPNERRFDYPVNYNTRFQPKSGEGVTFEQLRQLADVYDLLRVVIERRKDQIEAYEWQIVPSNKKKKAPDADIETLTAFFNQPSTEYSWGEWLRAMLEDLLVLDAVAISPRMTVGGGMYSFDLIDPGTIKRVIDPAGLTPMPPLPAYQQIIKGIPAVDFTSDELYYWMRNPRTNRVYGFSPVEWIIVTVNIALQRQAYTLSYFSEGNIPEALAAVPEGWTAAQIKEFQDHWDTMMIGDMGKRRRMRFVPTDASKIKELKQPDHKNEFEEWLARLVCFAFSISPSALIKDMNRATADTNKEIAHDEGLLPTMKFLRAKINHLIQRRMGMPHLQFEWKMGDVLDAQAQANVHKIYIDAKVLTPDEVRDDLGREALTPEQREAAFPTPVNPLLGMVPGGDDDEEDDDAKQPGAKKPVPAPKAKEEEEDDDAAVKQLLRQIVFSPTINVPEREVNVTVGDVNVTAEVPA